MKRAPLFLVATGLTAVVVGSAALLSSLRPAYAPEAALTVARPAPSPQALPSESPDASGPAASTAASAASTTLAATGGAPVARLSISRLGIHGAPIYDRGLSSKGVMLIARGYSVTHFAFSAPIGSGNAVLYGHDDIQGNIFGHLYDLAAGDLVQIVIGNETQTYRVTAHQIVAPTAVSVMAPTRDARLTIITCWPFNVDTKRWIVTAVRA